LILRETLVYRIGLEALWQLGTVAASLALQIG
jgi:hypothetical protein